MSRIYAFLPIRVWLTIVAFLILGTWYNISVPLGEGPDELPHFTVIRYITRNGSLPITPDEHQAFQPPLYYLIGAALTFWIDTTDFVSKANPQDNPLLPTAPILLHTRAEDFPWRGWALAWHLLRFVSLLMGALTIAAIYKTAYLINDERRFGLLAAMTIAFLPGFIFMSALVNNDNLAAMLAALLCWRITSLVTRFTFDWKRAEQIELAGFGLLLGLGVLAKMNLLAFVPVSALAILLIARAQFWGWRETVGALALVIGVATLVSGWYFVRNLIIFGDPLAWPLVLSANAVRTTPLDINGWLVLLGQLYRSFWLEWIGLALDPPLLWAVTLLMILAGLGLVVPLARDGWALLSARVSQANQIHVSRFALHMPLLTLAVALLVVILLSWIRWSQTVLGTGQARLWYPTLTVVIISISLGLRQTEQWLRASVAPRLIQYVTRFHVLPHAMRRLPSFLFNLQFLRLALVALLLLMALVTPLRYFAAAYAPAPRIAALPPSAQPLSATFKDKMRLIGWEAPRKRLRAGEMLHIALYWEALQDLNEDDWLKLQLLDANDKFLVFKDGSPSAGRDSTDSWLRGEKIASQHQLLIPNDALRGTYRLTIGVHPYGRKNWFPIFEENMWIAQGDQLVLTEVLIE